jgi:hypothetical protein
MLTISQYDHIIQDQYEDAERRSRDFRLVIRLDVQFFTRFFIGAAVRRIDQALPSFLIKAKGLLSDLQDREAELTGNNLKDTISHLERLINVHIFLNEKLALVEEDASIYPEIKTWSNITTETIETLYATLRLAKRYNGRAPRETSDLAVESSKRSLSSLETTSYGRRAT